MMLKTPIVLIIYRRPESTRGIVNDIRKVRPKTVFVVADGPKNKADEKNCELARDEIEKIQNFVGISGVFNMSQTDHNGLALDSMVMVTIDKGKWVLAK